MQERTLKVLRRGVEAAMIASIPQVLLPKIEERVFLHKEESADLGPRFVATLAETLEKPLPEDWEWIASSAFHFGYAAFRGAAYSLVQERVNMHPLVGGRAMGTLIHLMTFPAWGGAVLSGSEGHPRDRSWRMEGVLATAPLVFGLGTAFLYGRGPKRRGWWC